MLRTIISIGCIVLGTAVAGVDAYRTRKQLKDLNRRVANVNIMLAENASKINELNGQDQLDEEETQD